MSVSTQNPEISQELAGEVMGLLDSTQRALVTAQDFETKYAAASEELEALKSVHVKEAIVKRENGKWVLRTKDDTRTLGTHDTAHQAYGQEHAIQKSQEAEAAKKANENGGQVELKKVASADKISRVVQMMGDHQLLPADGIDKCAELLRGDPDYALDIIERLVGRNRLTPPLGSGIKLASFSMNSAPEDTQPATPRWSAIEKLNRGK